MEGKKMRKRFQSAKTPMCDRAFSLLSFCPNIFLPSQTVRTKSDASTTAKKLANEGSSGELRLGAALYDAVRQRYLPRPTTIIYLQDEFGLTGRVVDRFRQNAPVPKHLFNLERTLPNNQM